ncbi:potassium channel family protein [Aminipila sp.]|uniref:potassium channel family protein n=1 Tax=Aminipila sp. TaxID=2060095 RepID=UPI00289BC908|nr:NAD-binding protein [Aminipila sp.]
MFGLKKDSPHIIVVGCGSLGAYIAGKLSEEENSVTVIDKNKNTFEKLPAYFGGFVLDRDANDASVLLEARIENADAIIAVTGDDVLNMFVSKVAKDIYHVKNVFASLYDHNRKDAYQELGIKTIWTSDLWLDVFKEEVTL